MASIVMNPKYRLFLTITIELVGGFPNIVKEDYMFSKLHKATINNKKSFEQALEKANNALLLIGQQ